MMKLQGLLIGFTFAFVFTVLGAGCVMAVML